MSKKIFAILILSVFLVSFASAQLCYEDQELYSLGDSMFPLIKDNSLLIFEEIENVKDLKKGQIIDFFYHHFLWGDYNGYTHRIIKTGYDRKGWYAITKGDNNLIREPFKLREKNIGCKLIEINQENKNE